MLKRGTIVATAAILAATGCSDNAPGVIGKVNVTLKHTDAVVSQVVGTWSASAAENGLAAASVDPDTVETLAVRVTRIDFLPATEAEDEAAWISLELPEPAMLDLMALPSEGDSPLVVASGEVEAGEYNKVRLYTDSAVIRFKGSITVGRQTYDAGVDHMVTIPSGEQTGLKTDAGFTVDAESEADVHLLFSSGATFQNLTATGSGRIMLAPVIRSIPESQ